MVDAGPAVLSIGVLATFALALGGLRLLGRRDERRRAVLMLAAAAVLLGNVLLWAWPMPARRGAAAVSRTALAPPPTPDR